MPKVDDVSEVQLNLDTAAYASGELLCQAGELALVCVPNYPAFIESVTLLDYDDQGGALDLVFFRANPGNLGAVNAAVSLSNVQAEMVLGVVNVAATDYSDLGNQQIAQPQFYPIKARALDGSASVWVAGVARSASTYAGGRMLLKCGAVRVE